MFTHSDAYLVIFPRSGRINWAIGNVYRVTATRLDAPFTVCQLTFSVQPEHLQKKQQLPSRVAKRKAGGRLQLMSQNRM